MVKSNITVRKKKQFNERVSQIKPISNIIHILNTSAPKKPLWRLCVCLSGCLSLINSKYYQLY